MHLVDEQDDVAIGLFDLIQHTFQSLFKLTAIFGARNQTAHIERHQLAVFKAVWNVAIGDSDGQSFGNGGFTHTSLANQYGIIFGAARQYLDRAADFFVAADDGVKLALTRDLGQIAGEFFQRVITVFGARRISGPALA